MMLYENGIQASCEALLFTGGRFCCQRGIAPVTIPFNRHPGLGDGAWLLLLKDIDPGRGQIEPDNLGGPEFEC